jgi:hypothetical protein
MVLKPLFGPFSTVLRVIILLIYNVIIIFVDKFDSSKFFIQDLGIKVPFHLPINLACIPNPLPYHASPHYQDPLPNFFVPSTSLSLKPSPSLFHTHCLSYLIPNG